MALLTADWNPLGKNTYYRKFELYIMGWSEQVNLQDFIVAAAPYGGPVALIHDDKKLKKVQTSGKPMIFIFSSSGQLISSIKWNSGHIIQLGWSNREDLLCVQDDGAVLRYDIFGNYKHTFSMGKEVKDTKVLEAKIFPSFSATGIAVLTTSYRIFLVNSVQDPQIRKMAEIPELDIPPSSWAVISRDRHTQLLIAKDKEIFLLDQHHLERQFPKSMTSVNSIVEMAVSLDEKHIALCTDSGILWIGSANLKNKYCEFDTKCPSRPKQLVWCGTEAVVGYWDTVLLVVNCEKEWINYTFDATVHLVPEIDGVRIIGNVVHEMLQKVPSVVQEILRIGSMAPGAILLEASKEFQKQSHRADEYIRLVKDQLEEAVQNCIDAAGYEYKPSNQKMLIRAAQFGKGFKPDMNPEPFAQMCQTLRVLNAVRNYKLGLPLTYTQLSALTRAVLLDRLVLRRHYYLAIQICKYLQIPETEGSSRILAHWARYKVCQTQLDSDVIARDIADKLGYTPGISYSEIANTAAEYGRTQLAIKLLDYEPRASEQVPLLLKLDQDRQALMKAIESGDTDLIFTVILHLRDNMPVGEFQMTIRNFPLAQSLYMKYCCEQNPKALLDIYVQEDDFSGQAANYIRESYSASEIEVRLASLIQAEECYKKARNDVVAGLAKENHRLIKNQISLEEKFGKEYLDKSLHDTVYSLLCDGEVKLAEKLKQEFKIPDRRYWWMQVLALAEMGDWIELDKFSKSRKSPIGYEPFVDVCLKHNNKVEAAKYLPKVRDDLKVKYFVKAQMYEEAAQVAFERRDDQALLFVQSKCAATEHALVDKINTMKAQLGTRR